MNAEVNFEIRDSVFDILRFKNNLTIRHTTHTTDYSPSNTDVSCSGTGTRDFTRDNLAIRA
jgi:hypothetical protein